MSDCMCDWPATCGGFGGLTCDGCGGDLCVCECGGEAECFGCADCVYDEHDDESPTKTHCQNPSEKKP